MPATYASDLDLLQLFPELAAVPKSQRCSALRVTKSMVSASLGECLQDAHAARAGHMIAMSKSGQDCLGLNGTSSGQVVSESDGGASVSYASVSVATNARDSRLALTPYGQLFLDLTQNKRVGRPLLARKLSCWPRV